MSLCPPTLFWGKSAGVVTLRDGRPVNQGGHGPLAVIPFGFLQAFNARASYLYEVAKMIVEEGEGITLHMEEKLVEEEDMILNNSTYIVQSKSSSSTLFKLIRKGTDIRGETNLEEIDGGSSSESNKSEDMSIASSSDRSDESSHSFEKHLLQHDVEDGNVNSSNKGGRNSLSDNESDDTSSSILSSSVLDQFEKEAFAVDVSMFDCGRCVVTGLEDVSCTIVTAFRIVPRYLRPSSHTLESLDEPGNGFMLKKSLQRPFRYHEWGIFVTKDGRYQVHSFTCDELINKGHGKEIFIQTRRNDDSWPMVDKLAHHYGNCVRARFGIPRESI